MSNEDEEHLANLCGDNREEGLKAQSGDAKGAAAARRHAHVLVVITGGGGGRRSTR